VVSLHLCFLVSFHRYTGSPSSASSSRLRSGVSDVAGHSLALVFVRGSGVTGAVPLALGSVLHLPSSPFFCNSSFLPVLYTQREFYSLDELTNTTLFSLSFSGLLRSVHNLVLLRCVPERRVARTPSLSSLFLPFSLPVPRGLGATGDGPTLSSVKLWRWKLLFSSQLTIE
jgi:hypothetical protein